MQVQTILNRLYKHKSFVYERARWGKHEGAAAIEVPVRPRANGRPICSGCGKKRPGYDRLAQRRYQFVPLWGLAVFLLYAPRRVQCPRCGVKVERLPWATGKSRLTTIYMWFLANWAKRLSWQEVAEVFGTSWNSVFRSVRLTVLWGIVHRTLDGIKAIGIDEIQWQKGHHYLTLVYQIENGCKRLLYVGMERTEASLRDFFEMLGEQRSKALEFIASDMWQPYLTVIAEKAGQAVHVLDRFHIMAQMNKAIDEVRAGEVKRLKQEGRQPVLKHSRWCLLKRPENLTSKQTVKLAELLKCNLRTVRAYLLREDFQRFWDYKLPACAGRFVTEWCNRVMRSRLQPMKRVAKMLRRHHELILNWFRAKGTISSGVVEGLNYNAKLTMKKAYGYRTAVGIKIALYHRLGALPEPEFTHKFW